MQTLGYAFAPWRDAQSIADGPSILRYVKQTAAEYRDRGADPLRPPRDQRRLGQRRQRLDGRGASAATPARRCSCTCSFLLMCTGYYDYAGGYTPQFEGAEDFAGEIVHPQHWPEDLDYAGKRVVVIGSGATAITLVPAMARTAAHVTMLQRSPSYVVSLPGVDPLAKLARRLLPEMARLSARALEERAADEPQLPAQPPPPAVHEGGDPARRPRAAARRFRRRRALHAAL